MAGLERSMKTLGLQDPDSVASKPTKRTAVACAASAMFATTVEASSDTPARTRATWSQALVSSPAQADPQTT